MYLIIIPITIYKEELLEIKFSPKENYCYMVKDIDPKNYRPVPSLPLAIVASYRGMTQEEIEKALFNYHDNNITLHGKNNYVQNDIHIHMAKGGRITPIFIGNYERFDREVNLDQLLKEYGREQPANDTIFKNKIVFVGGSYDKRDFYYTPLGRMSGLEVVANITQSILSGTLITHMSFLKAFIIELILGSIVAVIFVLTSPCRASIICFIALIPAIVLASYLAFSTSYYWFDFVPTIAGVMVHGLISKREKSEEVSV